ncbi:MAG: ABC transporter permease [Lachnospiraceae bacterium]|nr:ABC transporter permease [Lachnospiraceae bacterium]
MKTKLSAWKYVKNNKRVVGVLVTSLSLSFMAMYLMYVLLQTTVESFKPIMLELPKRVSYASLEDRDYGIYQEEYESYEAYDEAVTKKRNDLIERMKARPGISEVYYAPVINCMYQSVMGQFSYEVPLLSKEQIQGFLDHIDAKFTGGKMPSGEGEILVDEVLMKNAGFEIGDWFMADWYGEQFRVVGTIKSKYVICVGTPLKHTNNGIYLIVCNDETVTDLKSVLTDEGIQVSEGDSVFDAAYLADTYEEELAGVVSAVITGISVIVTVFLALLVMVAYISFMRNRVNEYCLYASIGYGRGEIYGMILREMAILFAFGTAIGLVLSLGGASLIISLLINPAGLIGSMLYPDRILKILAIYVFLMGILQIPVIVCVNKIKTIDAIED